ncbi:glycoside hydrolase superfamily [Sphaerosporella brunnea]|uniref:non-reducing end alpha-L-arabinofuranosidase n=1 Tax=Sphaerosporella brunnea TaxID=1250544 RepID=A0A5J5EUX1_9PEZI|nr:glycoside hydrolase superfamily [Sphaerosporella brunnea]
MATTFTQIAEDATPSISIDPDRVLSEIKDEIYSGFTEHMGRCIYGGLYDPGNPLSDENGFRTDVIDCFKELNCPVVRYPGGNFVATYHWYEGVGPTEKRPRRPELAWNGVETNEFGTDEFMKWCEVAGTKPYLALNMGTGTLDEALGWLEYCNSTQDTYWANKRRENGHPEPYNVKYWALGNECYGEWQVEQMTKEDYAKKAYQWAKALKLLDPRITLILCGELGYVEWDRYVLGECIKWADMHSIHVYTADKEHMPNATGPLSAERAIEICASLIDMARIKTGVKKRPTICFDEWNIWDPVRAPGDKGAEELYTVSDMLAMGVWCNVFIRQSRYLGMTNIAQSVNVISPLITTKTGLVKQTTWWVYLLFAKYMRGHTLGVHVKSSKYDGRTNPVFIESTMDVPWLDVSAAVNNGYVNLAVVNLHAEKAFETELKGVPAGQDVEVHLVTGEKLDDVNTAEKTTVEIKESKWTASSNYTFPKHSFTLLRWKL